MGQVKNFIFKPAKQGWTGAKAHFACFTEEVRQLEERLLDITEAYLVSEAAKEDLVLAYAARLEMVVNLVLETRLLGKIPGALFCPGRVSPAKKCQTAQVLGEELSLPEGKAALYDKYPRLQQLVRTGQDFFVTYVGEFLQHFRQERPKLEEKFWAGRSCQRIQRLVCDAGDAHNQGRVTMVVETDAGKCVYKPHDVQIDVAMHRFLSKYFADFLLVPAVVAGNGYGFCEFVENQPASTPEETKDFFYNLGGMLAVLHMLGAFDFHKSNILSFASKPVPIDMENIINLWYNEQDEANIPAQLAKLVSYSVLRIGVDSLCREGHENSLLFDVSEGNKPAPLLQGKRITVKGYEERLLAGFRSGYERSLEQKAAIREDLANLQQVPLRVIVRNTQSYMTMLLKSYMPVYMKDNVKAKRKMQQALLKARVLPEVNMPDFVESELAALLWGDIPYFYALSDGRDLCSGGRVVVKDFIAQGMLQAVMSRLDNMDETDLAFQCRMLQQICRKVIAPRQQEHELNKTTKVSGNQPAGAVTGDEQQKPWMLSNETLVSEAEELWQRMMADSLLLPDGSPCWFDVNDQQTSAMELLGTGLADGIGGIALFAAALAKLSPHENIRQQARKTADMLEQLRLKTAGSQAVLDQEYAAWQQTVREQGKQSLPEARELADRGELVYCDNLAWGNGKLVEALLTGHPEDLERARMMLSHMMLRARENGNYTYLEDSFQNIFIPSYLHGAAGIGYVMLRLVELTQGKGGGFALC